MIIYGLYTFAVYTFAVYTFAVYILVLFIYQCVDIKKANTNVIFAFLKVTAGSKTIALNSLSFQGSVSDLRYEFACGDLESLFPRALILLRL